MADFSRREFIRKGSIGVAAGVAAIGLGAEGGIAHAATRATNETPAEHGEAITSVTIIANYIPLQFPAGGPNFFEFGDDVAYDIHISNGRRPGAAITYRFRFQTSLRNDETFLYNTGPIDSLTSTSWNRRQFYSVTK